SAVFTSGHLVVMAWPRSLVVPFLAYQILARLSGFLVYFQSQPFNYFFTVVIFSTYSPAVQHSCELRNDLVVALIDGIEALRFQNGLTDFIFRHALILFLLHLFL